MKINDRIERIFPAFFMLLMAAATVIPHPFRAMSSAKQPPLMIDQIIGLISLIPDSALAGEIRDRGINFPVSAETLNNFKRAGAGRVTIETLSSFMSNRPPSVVFNFEQPDLQAGQPLTIIADVQDPDGDELEYFWATSTGLISGDGAISRLVTSEIDQHSIPSRIVISLTVIDRKGGSASYSKSITVRGRSVQEDSYDVKPDREQESFGTRARQEAWMEDKNALIRLEGTQDNTRLSWGFIEVTFSVAGSTALLHTATGMLPGRPCRVDIIARENIADYSFKEPPGTFNKWNRVIVRARPARTGRPARLAIYWQAIPGLSAR